ncbi:MAG: hypothetical protein WB947_00495 [Thermoplasmata archaeon]
MRILIRPRWPVVALLLLAPSIPELLTGSTPITTLFFDPAAFAINFLGIVGLYGTGALLIREFVVKYQKGWASVLLLGAAYGIAEEGLAVHTFFEPAGLSPVGALGWYGHAFGVNWLWALGLTAFHATYSIALPILLTQLWFPAVRSARWLDAGAVGIVAAIYLFVVGLFAFLVGHGPTPALLALFLGVVGLLLLLAYLAPADLLSVRPGPSRVGSWGLGLDGAAFFTAWLAVLILSGSGGRVSAVVAALLLVATSLASLCVVLRYVGTENLDRAKFSFAAGMLGILFVFDFVVEFSVPGILLVSAAFVYLLYRLHRTLRAREQTPVPRGATGGPVP